MTTMQKPPQPPTSNPRGLKGIISRVSSIRDAYPNSVLIYRDLNTTYQSCYEIAVNVSEQYNSYRRAGQRIPGIRSLLTDCDAILKKVHGFLQRYSSLRSQRPASKEKFAFVSEDIGFQRRRVEVCRGKLGEVQRLLQGADYSSQQNVTADEPRGDIPAGDIPGDTDPAPPVEEDPIDQKPPPRSRSQKRNTRLATAASAYRWDEVRSLIERGADGHMGKGNIESG
ncbi:hypothetical protein N7533_001669 [Penicillium manginii]|uniref:uncharacterized protein n=1 Tax=Penicillium manginii TaxID=203109 RepID=UPI002546BBD0|nr:uncharacterized protein N7533_001669 [Penicillium manginii]KAJ5762988.1 hypothetical protein N7533_001669 [Penicillium manginii]